MKIKVSSIPREGVDCKEIYIPEVLDLDRYDIKINKPFEVSYHIYKEGNELFINAKVKIMLEIICARCLEREEILLAKEYHFEYLVKDTDLVDTTDDIRQEIILDYPLKPLCKTDCLGLCPKCGGNLNRGECKCGG